MAAFDRGRIKDSDRLMAERPAEEQEAIREMLVGWEKRKQLKNQTQ